MYTNVITEKLKYKKKNKKKLMNRLCLLNLQKNS